MSSVSPGGIHRSYRSADEPRSWTSAWYTSGPARVKSVGGRVDRESCSQPAGGIDLWLRLMGSRKVRTWKREARAMQSSGDQTGTVGWCRDQLDYPWLERRCYH